MASWMEERDRLVAQAAAFVQQVAAAHPQISARPEIENLLADRSVAIEPAPFAPAAAAPQAEPAMPIVQPPAPRLQQMSERSDIQERVAAFRARQARMNDEREAYYETVRAKIRSQLGNVSGSGRL